MNILQKLVLVIGFTSATSCHAGDIVWLSDTSGWEKSAGALRERGFEVKDEKSMGAQSGLVIRVMGALNNLTASRGTPYGGYAVGVQVMYRCAIGPMLVELNPSAQIGNYSFTGKTATEEMSNIIATHTNTVLEAYKNANLKSLVESCDSLRGMVSRGKGAAKLSSKSKQ